jgi:cytochrome c-type biogenesis protein CcmH
MTRWASVVGVGLVAALVAVILLRPVPAATDTERAEALAGGLRCPDCAGLSVADSHTASAVEIRRQIDELIADGATDADVREHFTDRYGEWVLLAPSAPAWWLLPFAVVLAAAAALGVWLVRRRGEPAPPLSISAEERRRVHDEAEALDA